MTRCDYDGIFYRVFLITLLGVALTFTIILTNVFVDIDGLLWKREETDRNNIEHTSKLNTQVLDKVEHIKTQDVDAAFYNDENNDDADYDNYRTKRSLESQDFLFHIKNPKTKKVLTNRLATLLEELDAEESLADKQEEQKGTSITPPIDRKSLSEKITDIEVLDNGETANVRILEEQNKESFHTAMHNILFQGIIGHMDINDVYKKVHSLIENSNAGNIYYNDKEERRSVMRIPDTENELFKELVNCKKLQEQIQQDNGIQREKINTETRKKVAPRKDPKLLIKTIIDITSLEKNKMDNESNSKENVKGIIRLIYNGKSVRFSNMDDKEMPTEVTNKPIRATTEVINEKAKKREFLDTLKNTYKEMPQPYLKFMEEYFKNKKHIINKSDSEETISKYKTKRIKRHVKIRLDQDDAPKKKEKKLREKDNDELYVEIETRFDSKGMKGEKKKKLIRNLIDKIKKAIHSDIPDKNEDQKLLHVKKRSQDPLDKNNEILVSKVMVPLDAVIERQLSPIDKSARMNEDAPLMSDNNGENWKKSYFGPGFLTASKSVNSAEMGEVDIDYSKVLKINGVSQRLQKPLNADNSEEIAGDAYYDLGNLKFFIKDIDGSGFSIGYNQYVDEPPDTDTIRLFTGVDSILNTYQNYDQVESTTEIAEVKVGHSNQNHGEMVDDETSTDHIIARRSIKSSKSRDYHSNEYKIIYDTNFLPFNNYQEIYGKEEENNKKFKSHHPNGITLAKKEIKVKESPLIIDENIFDRNLKPAEILGIADLFNRKKRSLNVKKITLQSKLKLNRYLNTKSMANKKIFMKKRSKRQIDKIRIIARDAVRNMPKHSEEDIFYVSDENVYADRATVREVEIPEETNKGKFEDHYDYIPYVYEESKAPLTYVNDPFNGRSRHNALMSKYPHVFLEEVSRSKEVDYFPENPSLYSQIIENHVPIVADRKNNKLEITTFSPVTTIFDVPSPKVQEIVNALAPNKANYKVTVKILPKNLTGVHSGFKEIHTSINKSFNKDGLLYSSLVNVSEISRIIKLNKSKESINNNLQTTESPLIKDIKLQQSEMNLLLQKHKERIDNQLDHLNTEKKKLQSMIDIKNYTDVTENPSKDYIDLILPLNPPKLIHLRKDEVNKLAMEAIIQHNFNTEPTTVPTTTTPTSTTPVNTEAKEKVKIIHTIEKNENITNEILRKIDKNTEILQMFLEKLSKKIDETVTRKNGQSLDMPKTDNSKDNAPRNLRYQPIHDPFFNQAMPNLEAHKNDTHVSIPFVYAYQQPFVLPNKPQMPVASVVYHGHIHTNAIRDISKLNLIPKHKPDTIRKNINDGKKTVNQTRFFIDDLENDYKAVEMNDVKNKLLSNEINVNKTILH